MLILFIIVFLITCYFEGAKIQKQGEAKRKAEQKRTDSKQKRKDKAMSNLRY